MYQTVSPSTILHDLYVKYLQNHLPIDPPTGPYCPAVSPGTGPGSCCWEFAAT